MLIDGTQGTASGWGLVQVYFPFPLLPSSELSDFEFTEL